jgi:Fe-S-cluster-containing hydrogenase component 2
MLSIQLGSEVDFVHKLRFSGRPYVFGIAPCGDRPGGALFHIKSLLEEKGVTVGSGFSIIMPDNYIGPIDLMGDAPHRQEKYTATPDRIPAITVSIRECRQIEPEGSPSLFVRFGGMMAKTFMTIVYNTPRRFYATNRCNQCRTCERICPTRNITVERNTVFWGSYCTQYYACIHWCPREAIEIGGRTAGKSRYHHPDVTLTDMLHQQDDQV